MVFGFGAKEDSTHTGSHTASHNNPIGNTADALNPTTGTGTHLPPTEQSHNPLSSHNDHVETTHSSNPFNHNETTGTHHGHGSDSLTGGAGTHHTGSTTGNVVDSLNPTTGTGSHLPPSDQSHNPLSSRNDHHDTAHSHNHLSHNETTGTGHQTLGQKAEIKKDQVVLPLEPTPPELITLLEFTPLVLTLERLLSRTRLRELWKSSLARSPATPPRSLREPPSRPDPTPLESPELLPLTELLELEPVTPSKLVASWRRVLFRFSLM
ncbi:hypothetical protein BDY24DRAFT_53279 [Mrakia frigida]|uniref:uncharacterized protein n=1 Tax=Mrakia frigida TaxID=29902 RepID=UPI003FCC11D4